MVGRVDQMIMGRVIQW